MQQINIDEIILKLQHSRYWNFYKSEIENEVWEENLELCIWKKWILEIWNSHNISENDNFWKWGRFENLMKEFLKLIFDEVNYCPNCWKSPFLSTWKLNLKSFDLDHFFPKSKYFHLMFNFYNLIPICPFCNQKIKRDRNPLDYKWNIFHPYFWVLENDNWVINFTNIFNLDNCMNFSNIWWKLSCNFNNWYSNFLNLKDIYLSWKDTYNTFDFIQDKRSKILVEKKNWIKRTNNEFKEYFFKNYVPETDAEILKYSNGKLKKDLIENLKI